jgi:hypothetical protein
MIRRRSRRDPPKALGGFGIFKGEALPVGTLKEPGNTILTTFVNDGGADERCQGPDNDCALGLVACFFHDFCKEHRGLCVHRSLLRRCNGRRSEVAVQSDGAIGGHDCRCGDRGNSCLAYRKFICPELKQSSISGHFCLLFFTLCRPWRCVTHEARDISRSPPSRSTRQRSRYPRFF